MVKKIVITLIIIPTMGIGFYFYFKTSKLEITSPLGKILMGIFFIFYLSFCIDRIIYILQRVIRFLRIKKIKK